MPIDGDTTEIMQAIGLTKTQRALIQNYNFMSGRIQGTRQIRRSINHVVFSSRVVYGLPVFMTVTPSERHSGLMIRLTRCRRNDPAIQPGNPEFATWFGHSAPSLHPQEDANGMEESVEMDLPHYDLRRLMAARDPLCCVDAFQVAIRVIVAQLYGLRMCPECPHCALSKQPCMDAFGSNATPMGGSAGRADALVGAVEAQKAEGVLHFHFFIYVQMAHQFSNLSELAELFRERVLSMDALKQHHNHLRCAEFPDKEKFDRER